MSTRDKLLTTKESGGKSIADNTTYKYYGQDESVFSQAEGERLRFPVASVFFLLIAFLYIISTILRIRFFGYGFSFSNYTLYDLLFFIVRFFVVFISIFVAIILLLKKRGAMLIVAVVLKVMVSIFDLIVTVFSTSLSGVSLDLYNIFSLTFFYLPYSDLLLLGLVLYCSKNQGSPHKRIFKLWFIPGILAILYYLFGVYSALPFVQIWLEFGYSGHQVLLIYFVLDNVLIGLLRVAAVFSLGYWISYIHSSGYNSKRTEEHSVGNANDTYMAAGVYSVAGLSLNSSFSQPDSSSKSINTSPPAGVYHTLAVSGSSSSRFCGACGAESLSSNEFCLACGSKLADQVLQPQRQIMSGENQRTSWTIYSRNIEGASFRSTPMYMGDSSSIGFAVLGFFFPLVGLILFIAWQKSMPTRAKSAGIGALVSVTIGIVMSCMFFFMIASTIPFLE